MNIFRPECVLVMAPAVQWHPQGLDCVVIRGCGLIFLQRCAMSHSLSVLNFMLTVYKTVSLMSCMFIIAWGSFLLLNSTYFNREVHSILFSTTPIKIETSIVV